MPGLRVSPGLLVGLPVAVGTAAVILAWLVLRVLPEPEPEVHGLREGDPPIEVKRLYRDLLRPPYLMAIGVLAAGMTLTTVLGLEPERWPVWFALALVGTLLAVIDAATTWLPNAVMHPYWVVTGTATILMAALTGSAALSAVTGAVAWTLVFWLVWLISRGQIGFGDVRFAVGLGAAAGAAGWATIYACLLAGTVVGALWGVLHRLRHGASGGPFAYGMALYLGCGLGLALTPG